MHKCITSRMVWQVVVLELLKIVVIKCEKHKQNMNAIYNSPSDDERDGASSKSSPDKHGCSSTGDNCDNML